MSKYILALDQGTTSSRCILYDKNANPIASEQKEFEQIFPKVGWVEHNAIEIWESQIAVIRDLLKNHSVDSAEITGIGITNQRETTVLWDKETGEPLHNAIVWQDRRTSSYCKQLVKDGYTEMIKSKTGLVIDAYFSATKVKWLLDNVPGAREKAVDGNLAFGTIDSWLVWNLTSGNLHITDVSNASRTMMYNIHELSWDGELLQLFDIPDSILPAVVPSSELYGQTDPSILGNGVPIAGIAGDQQAALFGQLCLEEGMAKSTYGTGCFLMLNTGPKAVPSTHNLLTTIAWQIDGDVTYALEGSVFVGGAVIQWLRDGLGLFEHASDSEAMASSVVDNGDIYFVPALTGLGAPYWDQDARGTIIGITRGTTGGHLTRAALESIAFQVNDLLDAMADDLGKRIIQLRIDGGAVSNSLLVQFQSDISGIEVLRPRELETTALGAAYLAGIGTGLWKLEDLRNKWQIDRSFHPEMEEHQKKNLISRWKKAVERSRNWAVAE